MFKSVKKLLSKITTTPKEEELIYFTVYKGPTAKVLIASYIPNHIIDVDIDFKSIPKKDLPNKSQGEHIKNHMNTRSGDIRWKSPVPAVESLLYMEGSIGDMRYITNTPIKVCTTAIYTEDGWLLF